MSIQSRGNKENFRLLDLSSDEESEDLQLEIIPSRKKKITRRERSRVPTAQVSEPNIGKEVKCAIQWAIRGTLLLWIIMLTWICAAMYDQVSSIQLEIDKVSTSSAGVGDALQICHTTAKEMRANTTSLNDRIAKLEAQHEELKARVNKYAQTLSEVSEQLSAAPKLADTPRRLAELQRTVADFGSQISEFNSTLALTKKQAGTAATGVDELRTLLQQLDARANDTIANVTAAVKLEEEIKGSLGTLNTTIYDQVFGLKSRIEEISAKNTESPPVKAVPVAASTVQPTPATVATTSTTVAPAPPVKPRIL